MHLCMLVVKILYTKSLYANLLYANFKQHSYESNTVISQPRDLKVEHICA